jgi:hypothetical protein
MSSRPPCGSPGPRCSRGRAARWSGRPGVDEHVAGGRGDEQRGEAVRADVVRAAVQAEGRVRRVPRRRAVARRRGPPPRGGVGELGGDAERRRREQDGEGEGRGMRVRRVDRAGAGEGRTCGLRVCVAGGARTTAGTPTRARSRVVRPAAVRACATKAWSFDPRRARRGGAYWASTRAARHGRGASSRSTLILLPSSPPCTAPACARSRAPPSPCTVAACSDQPLLHRPRARRRARRGRAAPARPRSRPAAGWRSRATAPATPRSTS